LLPLPWPPAPLSEQNTTMVLFRNPAASRAVAETKQRETGAGGNTQDAEGFHDFIFGVRSFGNSAGLVLYTKGSPNTSRMTK